MSDTPNSPPTDSAQEISVPTRVVLGLLGGIGAGKSHVARRLAAVGGAQVIDADAEARVALTAAAEDGSLAQALGQEFVEAGRPRVEHLGQRVFEDPALLRKLERLLHPHVHTAIRQAISKHRAGTEPAVLVIDAPLLIEVGLDRDCDTLWYVEVPEDVRLERADRRGITPEELRRRETFQTPMRRKRARADRIIRNDVDDDALDEQIRAGLRALDVPVAEVPPPLTTQPKTTSDLDKRDEANN